MTIKGDGITNARPVTSSSAKPMASLKEDELGQGGILNKSASLPPPKKQDYSIATPLLFFLVPLCDAIGLGNGHNLFAKRAD